MTELMKEYKRVVITGTLTCKSDLHVGDGDLVLLSERNEKNTTSSAGNPAGETAKVLRMVDGSALPKKKVEGKYNSVCLDYTGKAYIPASTLRGSLAATLKEDTSFFKKIFGFTEGSGNQPGRRRAGALRVHDAVFDKSCLISQNFSRLPGFSEKKHTFLRHSVTIDSVTGTAEKGKLFCYELVPEHTVFSVSFEAEDLTGLELQQLLVVLELWNNSSTSSFGSGVTKGYGQVQWERKKVEVLTSKEELKWLEDESLEPFVLESVSVDMESADVSPLLPDIVPGKKEFRLYIKPLGPLLINEPGYVIDGKFLPDLEFSRRGDKAIIPSRTLAGLARGRARRILATIAHLEYNAPYHQAEKIILPLINSFFGSEEKRSALWLSEALGKAEEHKQEFIGVDRFTGGVNQGDNYNVRAANCEKLETGNCFIDLKLTPAGNWWKGMLLLVLRDAIESDLQVGWGKAKGYGAIACQIEYNGTVYNEWNDLLSHLTPEKAHQWVQELHKTISLKVTESGGAKK